MGTKIRNMHWDNRGIGSTHERKKREDKIRNISAEEIAI